MAAKDPLLWCGEIAWYLTERDADCGYRSSFGGQIAAIEGASGSGGAGAERWLHLTSTFHSGGRAGSPIARDRVMRPRWAALSAFHRDVLGAYYTGRVLLSNGDAAPLGKLGRFAPVAVFLAKLGGTERALLSAIAREGNGTWVRDAETVKAFRAEAELAVREAHQSYYDVVALETPPDPDEADDAPSDLLAEMALETGVFSVSGQTVQREGRWVQR